MRTINPNNPYEKHLSVKGGKGVHILKTGQSVADNEVDYSDIVPQEAGSAVTATLLNQGEEPIQLTAESIQFPASGRFRAITCTAGTLWCYKS